MFTHQWNEEQTVKEFCYHWGFASKQNHRVQEAGKEGFIHEGSCSGFEGCLVGTGLFPSGQCGHFCNLVS